MAKTISTCDDPTAGKILTGDVETLDPGRSEPDASPALDGGNRPTGTGNSFLARLKRDILRNLNRLIGNYKPADKAVHGNNTPPEEIEAPPSDQQTTGGDQSDLGQDDPGPGNPENPVGDNTMNMELKQSLIDNAPEDETRAAWHDRLAEIGRQEGFFETLGPEHSALFARRGKTLVVTFDNLDDAYERGENRMPWGFEYTTSRGWSVLGLMAHNWTWYRDEAVFDFFDRLKSEDFFGQFDRVVFYGASMGAYAASVFSSAVPGATVVCISPQATLDREIAPWETRYHKVWKRNFKNRYGYAPQMVGSAEKVYLFYDPTSSLDSMHAALYQGDNLVKLKCRFMGHRIASLWMAMGVLKPVVEACIEGTLTETEFYRLMRKRHETPRYQKEMLKRLRDQKRLALTVRYCQAILSRRGAPNFRKEMKRALQLLEQRK